MTTCCSICDKLSLNFTDVPLAVRCMGTCRTASGGTNVTNCGGCLATCANSTNIGNLPSCFRTCRNLTNNSACWLPPWLAGQMLNGTQRFNNLSNLSRQWLRWLTMTNNTNLTNLSSQLRAQYGISNQTWGAWTSATPAEVASIRNEPINETLVEDLLRGALTGGFNTTFDLSSESLTDLRNVSLDVVLSHPALMNRLIREILGRLNATNATGLSASLLEQGETEALSLLQLGSWDAKREQEYRSFLEHRDWYMPNDPWSLPIQRLGA
eukprot:CAMPEP_0195120134 /NCGR_PEP_ID=MMETSP0448-20130528/121160_1 /TAXON_ID=66468 /ORGANISM="Heterocapsa triquestra, Strain CCMP 448" /LENGTH=267 /DNA_ID=CAMNT_0040157527 /DNA_START=95 /DNA_END=895 /DNA_ORIENTATION=-